MLWTKNYIIDKKMHIFGKIMQASQNDTFNQFADRKIFTEKVNLEQRIDGLSEGRFQTSRAALAISAGDDDFLRVLSCPTQHVEILF